jgi:hypothetical protein
MTRQIRETYNQIGMALLKTVQLYIESDDSTSRDGLDTPGAHTYCNNTS